MRKLLLASSAVLGASMGLAAYAQAQSVNNADTADNNPGTLYSSSGDSFATPGSVTVRLNGRFRFFGGVDSVSGAVRNTAFVPLVPNTTVTTTTGATAALPVITTANGGYNKVSNYGVGDYARIYPGFDGVAANGLKYGASLEIRQDNVTGAPGGIYGSNSTNSRETNQLYFRREWGYVGTDKFGTIRVGSADGPTTLYETGTFENFDQGSFNGDAAFILPGNAQLVWPFPDGGAYYASTKIVYLSPQFYGFDGGISWEPTTAVGGQVTTDGCAGTSNVGTYAAGSSAVASPGCDSLSSTSTGDYSRRRNTIEALIRYRGTFGPVGVATTSSIVHSGRVLYNGTAPQPGSLALGAVAPTGYLASPQYTDVNILEEGLVFTYGGLQFGGNAMYGHFNTLVSGAGGQGNNLSPKGAEMSLAWTMGVSYAIGPVIFGISYLDSNTPGDTTAFNNITTRHAANQRRERGIDIGSTYTVAPGISLFAVMQVAQRKQNGFNFVSNSGTTNTALFVNPGDGCANAGATAANGCAGNTNVHSKIQERVFSLGSSFAW